jgi:rare lipoprotein A
MNSLSRSRRRSVYAVCVMAFAALALPASGWASSGGSGLSPGGSGIPSSSGTSTNQSASVQSGNVSVSATGNGITLVTNASAMLRRGVAFSGTAPSRLAGDTIEIERSGHQTNWLWAPTVTATVRSDGSFAAVWHANHIGRFSIRAVVSSPSVAQSSTTTPALTITVYRPSLATQYGPGFYGHRTACGQKLTKVTIGLANRTLKCGTKVAVYYQGRTMIVPVIDRGPYANSADWDLTEATGQALGISGTAQVGAVSLPAP